jgi:hypothetical protein
MPAAFQPLSAIAPAELIEYLGREGNSPEIVKWKYFHSGFNRGRERGYVWVKDGKLGGFIGLIPFRLSIGGRTAEAAWTCDWSVQDQTGRGTGILLIRQAQESYEFLTQLGGNEATQRIISRLAAFTSNDAGVMFYLPLRLGAILRLARRSLPRFPFDAIGMLNRLPLRWPRRTASNSMIVEPGVSKVLNSVLDADDHGDMYSQYDLQYVQWQIGDCPVLLSETCYPGGDAAPGAAALLWRERSSPEFWRMKLWVRQGAQKEADALVSGVIRRVYDSGGFLLAVLASRLDTTSINLLRAKHFFALPRRRPLHIIDSKKTGKPLPEMWPLSFLDTDLAYRIYVNP